MVSQVGVLEDQGVSLTSICLDTQIMHFVSSVGKSLAYPDSVSQYGVPCQQSHA